MDCRQQTGFSYKMFRCDTLLMAYPDIWCCCVSLKVWNHFDAGGCPGQAVGVKTMLDNGVFGYIPLKNLSDSHVSHPEERVRVSNKIICFRVT